MPREAACAFSLLGEPEGLVVQSRPHGGRVGRHRHRNDRARMSFESAQLAPTGQLPHVCPVQFGDGLLRSDSHITVTPGSFSLPPRGASGGRRPVQFFTFAARVHRLRELPVCELDWRLSGHPGASHSAFCRGMTKLAWKPIPKVFLFVLGLLDVWATFHWHLK